MMRPTPFTRLAAPVVTDPTPLPLPDQRMIRSVLTCKRVERPRPMLPLLRLPSIIRHAFTRIRRALLPGFSRCQIRTAARCQIALAVTGARPPPRRSRL